MREQQHVFQVKRFASMALITTSTSLHVWTYKNFRFGRKTSSLTEFQYLQWPVSVQRTAGICLGSRTLVVIGFDVSVAFVPVMHACHDTTRHHTHYTEMNLLRDAAGFQRAAPRPDWQQGQFFQWELKEFLRIFFSQWFELDSVFIYLIRKIVLPELNWIRINFRVKIKTKIWITV